jgi:hypothetical protein
MLINTTTMENSMGASQKTKNRTATLKECKSGYYKGSCTPMFIAALFTIAKLWKQTRCPATVNGLRKCGIYV